MTKQRRESEGKKPTTPGLDLPRTWHESEAAGQLHDPRGRPGGLEDGAVGADVAAGQDGCQVVGDGKGGSAAHLHGGGGGGHRGLSAAGGARQTGDGERRLQRVLLDRRGRGGLVNPSFCRLISTNGLGVSLFPQRGLSPDDIIFILASLQELSLLEATV